jgi:hypothetical protein
MNMDIKDSQHIGVYNTTALLEWAQMLVEQYGSDKEVQVFQHESTSVKAKALVASDDGEEPYVVVTSYTEV